ncbi:MAG TPA: SAM-dependent methyltransferase [Dehalococcoidia bacterium]|nr:SAM-dependent methyltransferase [Dehalococcoidia bacterium]
MALDLDPGTAGLGNPRLIKAIAEEIDRGAIPFDKFMSLALYHPEHGYYRKAGRIGPQGDFVTSSSVHPLFGWTIAGWCHWVWEQLGSPAEFTIVEPGAGDGRLAAAILDWAAGRDDRFAESLQYVAIEPNAPGVEERVTWVGALVPPVEYGAVISNEFFDALPVKLYEASEQGPVEIGVRWDGKQFVEANLAVGSIDGAPASGRFEVNPGLWATMQSLAGLVGRGAVLTFDYGYPREELWASWRHQGTLLAFYKHTAHENPYIHVGEQDLTAHVDFTTLEAALDGSGFKTFGPAAQSEFLYAVGLPALVDAARSDLQEYFGRRRVLETLTDGAGLGRVRVLAGTRGFEGVPPGFQS